ncbi:MAG: ammonium transporter [Verrucomicrobiales bacterium]|jgi:Amt family ammonium transporter|nr:ammonium transporter [Verrucomicrobiales bacterium]MBP9225300.1 ammonium transporter [Verrucomicrobiales bacterium]
MRDPFNLKTSLLAALVVVPLLFGTLIAQDAAPAAPEASAAAEAPPAPSAYSDEAFIGSPGYATFAVNNIWICISAGLVFIMHLGFATLESGLCQSKNTVNILFKNVWIVTSGILLYAFWGFNSMYPGDGNGTIENYFAMGSWFGGDLNDPALTTSKYNAGYTWWGDFLFQAMFAATAATIVSGAVAERVKLGKFMIFAVLLVGIAYPISGYWKWGGGWLNDMGFYDFAGSSVVHAFGGFAALACVLILGPRKGKFTKDGVKPILGHSMPMATIGVFLLWLGWFGFNGGSALSADPKAVSFALVTTALAACAGAVGSIGISWIVLKKPDLSMALNGILAGLVGITAGADTVSEGNAILIGLIAGIIVVFAIVFFDKIKIDDPVGAISVHGVCGVWGTLAVGMFSFNPEHTFGTQLIGTLSIGIFAFVFSFVVFFILKALGGVRVSEEEEHEGLDVAEHGAPAYHI